MVGAPHVRQQKLGCDIHTDLHPLDDRAVIRRRSPDQPRTMYRRDVTLAARQNGRAAVARAGESFAHGVLVGLRADTDRIRRLSASRPVARMLSMIDEGCSILTM